MSRSPILTIVVQRLDRETLRRFWMTFAPHVPGEKGMQSRGDGMVFSFYEYPRTAEQKKTLLSRLDHVSSEVGLDPGAMAINWADSASASRNPATDVVSRVLTWKFEDGPETAPDEGSPDDVGPAWLTEHAADGSSTVTYLSDGGWVTRAEAQRLAVELDSIFDADD